MVGVFQFVDADVHVGGELLANSRVGERAGGDVQPQQFFFPAAALGLGRRRNVGKFKGRFGGFLQKPRAEHGRLPHRPVSLGLLAALHGGFQRFQHGLAFAEFIQRANLNQRFPGAFGGSAQIDAFAGVGQRTEGTAIPPSCRDGFNGGLAHVLDGRQPEHD